MRLNAGSIFNRPFHPAMPFLFLTLLLHSPLDTSPAFARLGSIPHYLDIIGLAWHVVNDLSVQSAMINRRAAA